jgi:hypothetical protein
MPLLLQIGMGLCGLMAGIASIGIPFMVLVPLFSSTFTVNDHPATRAEFLMSAWPLYLGFPLIAGVMGLITYGLWKERPWTREAMMAYWVTATAALVLVQLVDPVPAGEFTSGLFGGAVCGAIAAWYLYGSEGVTRYYAAIAARSHPTIPSS